MRIVFLSNFYNHHQSCVSNKLYELTNGQYRFIETMELPTQQRNLGYSDLKDEFVIFYNNDITESQEWIDNADVVIIGSADEKLLLNRKKNNKLIFRYAERPLKNGFELWKYPIRWYKWNKANPKNKAIYMLCASAYTADDYAKFGLFKNKAFKWGYFPECKKYDDVKKIMGNKNPKEILWCGRLLDWKHPEMALYVAENLKKEAYNVHISIIGIGEMEEYLKQYIKEKELQEYVSLLGAIKSEKVREYMERAGILLLTSDRKEGWGAVLNEAMNSGCAVIANSEIGSVPYLVTDEKNGLLYENRNVNMLCDKVKYLLEHEEEQKRLGLAAYHTIIEEWNGEIAADRLVKLAECILSYENYKNAYQSGPCSKA